jgi:hypothetical protein
MTPYSGPLSMFGAKCHIAAIEKGLPRNVIMVPFTDDHRYEPKHPEILRINPKHQVPIVIGSTTAGADGNLSGIPLPSRLQSMISGIGVFHPDHKPTQRIGVVLDIVVRPTLAGIRAGRDEVLEAVIHQIVGRR